MKNLRKILLSLFVVVFFSLILCVGCKNAAGGEDPLPGDPSTVPENPSTPNYDTSNWKLGATVTDTGVEFAVYSRNATRIMLEIYDVAYGKDAKYEYWMEKGSDDIWHVKVEGIGHGTLYAYRAWGPNWIYDENWKRGDSMAGYISNVDSNGNRFNPNKVLFDPYAKEITHDKSNTTVLGNKNAGMFGTGYGRSELDTGRYAPKAVVIDDNTNFGKQSQIPQEKAIIYEAHVRGITNHESSTNLESILAGIEGFDDVVNIPEEYRGTYKGAGMLAPYLKALGVNTIELLPVHESDNDGNPENSPGGNYWAYMTYGYFAPDRRYSYDKSYGGPTKEFKEMVKAFHDAGMEVYLDVVFNHSGEGGTWGDADSAELTFMRGLDNSTYYCLTGDNKYYWDSTGCGNNLQCDNPVVRKLILDSLNYWIDEMGVDGFRFDLAPVLGRVSDGTNWNFDSYAQTIVDISDLAYKKNIEMIAEAWDIGTYQVGNFPGNWGEWNGRFRDAIRNYVGSGKWNADGKDMGNFIYGDSQNFGLPQKSVNFVVAHDGFTLADLCSYGGAGNSQNGTLSWPFGPSDGGNSDNNNLSFGTDPIDKRRAARNYIAIQMMSRGVPMIVWGDEFSRTQNGNNNPYNIDSVATWSNYNMINTSSPHTVDTGYAEGYHNNFGTFNNNSNVNGNFMFMKYMLNLRANEPALNQNNYSSVAYNYNSPNEWNGATRLHIDGSVVSGGSDYLVCMNMTGGDVDFTIPSPETGKKWICIVDTQYYFETNFNCWNENTAYDKNTYDVKPWSVVIFKEI